MPDKLDLVIDHGGRRIVIGDGYIASDGSIKVRVTDSSFKKMFETGFISEAGLENGQILARKPPPVTPLQET